MSVTQEDIKVYKELIEHIDSKGINGKSVPMLYGDSACAEMVMDYGDRNKTVHYLHDVLVKGVKPEIHDMLQRTVNFYYKSGQDGTIVSFQYDCNFAINGRFPFIEQNPLDTVGTLNALSSPDEVDMNTYLDLCYVVYVLLFIRIHNLDNTVYLATSTPEHVKEEFTVANAIDRLEAVANRTHSVKINSSKTDKLIGYFRFFVEGKIKDTALSKLNVTTVFEDSLLTRSLLHTYKDELYEMIKCVSEVLSGESHDNSARILHTIHEGIRKTLMLSRLTSGEQIVTDNVVLFNILNNRCPELDVSQQDALWFLESPLLFSGKIKTVLYMGLFILEDFFMFRSKLDSKSIAVNNFEKSVIEMSTDSTYYPGSCSMVKLYALIPRYVLLDNRNGVRLNILGPLTKLLGAHTENFDFPSFADSVTSAYYYLVTNDNPTIHDKNILHRALLALNSVEFSNVISINDLAYIQDAILDYNSGKEMNMGKIVYPARRILVGLGIKLLQNAANNR